MPYVSLPAGAGRCRCSPRRCQSAMRRGWVSGGCMGGSRCALATQSSRGDIRRRLRPNLDERKRANTDAKTCENVLKQNDETIN